MKRKIVMTLAMSIDGYIASEDGGFEWIVGDGDETLDTEKKWDYFEFLNGVDVVVMGKKCYDQGFHKDFKGKKVYVATSQRLENHENVHFIGGDICKEIKDETEKDGKDIFLFGGGVLIDTFIKEDIIDEYIIGIIPTILGNGRPLFLGNSPKIDLHLTEYNMDKGIAVLRYVKQY